ncbi:hypothetical protein HDU81_000508 [Chytriomyces hyalinus]|nr:hypothetical protein HDU81_000508 [Chytriomyces hyalinus]
MANERYLNVKYRTLPVTQVDVTGITWLGGLQQAVNKALAVSPAYGLIQLYDTNNTLITDPDDIHDVYYRRIKNGGLALRMQTTPPPSREACSSSVIANTYWTPISSVSTVFWFMI